MVQTQDFTWEQGSDLSIQLIYKEGATVESAVAVDLSTNYDVRMDIVVPGNREIIYTFNSDTLADADPLTGGNQPDSEVEGVLSSGAGGTPNITITVPRSLTLPGGRVWAKMVATVPVMEYDYDVFLRNTATDRQAKILEGSITIRRSNTLWL